VYRFCPPPGICMCSSLYLTLFMSLPPHSDLPLTLSLLHPHLYNTACHFAQLFLDHQILKVKAPSSLKMLRNSHPQGHILEDSNHHHQGNFVRKEICAVSSKCIILSHFQSFSLEYNVAESFSSHTFCLVFMWHFTSYMARLIFTLFSAT